MMNGLAAPETHRLVTVAVQRASHGGVSKGIEDFLDAQNINPVENS